MNLDPCTDTSEPTSKDQHCRFSIGLETFFLFKMVDEAQQVLNLEEVW